MKRGSTAPSARVTALVYQSRTAKATGYGKSTVQRDLKVLQDA